jgi:hypothetical protein
VTAKSVTFHDHCPPRIARKTTRRFRKAFSSLGGRCVICSKPGRRAGGVVYDHEKKIGVLRGGDIGWDRVVIFKDGRVNVMLGKAEKPLNRPTRTGCWSREDKRQTRSFSGEETAGMIHYPHNRSLVVGYQK